MNIKNQIRLSVLISLILAVVISASIFASYQNMQDLRSQEALAADVVKGSYELTYLSNDYLINAEPRARLQWEERYASLQPVISQLKSENDAEAQSLAIIRDYNEKCGVLFREIPEPGTLSTGSVLFPTSYQQVTWSRINVQSQGMIYEAWRLRHMYNDNVNQARFWNNILVLFLMVLMLVIISVNYLLISRRLVRSIREVTTGSNAFATGNLDYRIPLQGTDEIGEIGAGLNAMAAHLKNVTASRDELDREVVRRRQAEEALITKNTDLEAAYEEITATEEELKANYDELGINQQVLAESKHALSDIVEKLNESQHNARIGSWEWDLENNHIWGSDETYRIFGVTPQDYLPSFEENGKFIHPDDFVTYSKSFNHSLQTGEPLDVDLRVIARDGTQKYCHIYGKVILNDTGKPARIIGTLMDITRSRQAEAQMVAAQHQYRELFDNVSIGIFRSTPGPEGILIEVNPAAIRIFEADSREQLLGVRPSDLYFDPNERRRISEEIVTKGAITGIEVRYTTLKGRAFWGRITLTKKVSDNGEIYFDNTIEDISGRKTAEEDLRASEEKFSTAFKTSPYAITITHIKDGNFIEVNDAFTPITGFSHEEALSGSSIGLGLWVDAEDRKRVIATLLDGRSVKGDEFLFRKKNGGIITGLFSAQIISLRNEPCILSSILDITDRKRMEEALLESKEKYRDFFMTSRDCVFITSPEGAWIDFNDAAMEIFGYDSREEFAQIPVKDLYFIEGERAATTALILKEGFVKEYPVRLKRKDTTIINTLITAAPLRNPDNSIKAFIGTIRDVTQQKRAELQIKTSEIRYRRLFESAKDGILILNRDTGEIIDANPFIESLLGYAPRDLLGKHLWDIGLFNDQVLSKIAFEDLQKKEYIRYEDLPLETVGGQRIDVEFVSNIYRVDPTTSVIQCNIRDITDRKRSEAQREMLIEDLEQKNSELERFNYTVSHDLKSPLITIKWFAGRLEDDTQAGDPVQMKKDAHRITDAADIMQALLADLLELSRVGRIVKPPETIGFGTIVHEAVDLLAASVAERGVTVEIAPDLPVVNVDHARLREAMVNLIENAIKFAGTRSDPLIRIGVDDAGKTPVFFVQDNGIGIDPPYLDRIFNLFERLDVSTHGTGIGLVIVRRIIEVHGGKCWVESEGLGKGTTFRFTLPGPNGANHP